MSNASSSARQAILERAQSIVGAKGFSAVGLNEILHAAQVPKGSFYHYFNSKDAFGVVLLDTYFDQYVEGMQQLLDQPGLTHHAKLMRYWQGWIDNHTGCTDTGKCLAVKLGLKSPTCQNPCDWRCSAVLRAPSSYSRWPWSAGSKTARSGSSTPRTALPSACMRCGWEPASWARSPVPLRRSARRCC